MATDYFNDYQAYMASGALASPARTPERTPPAHPRSKAPSRGRPVRDFSSISAPLPSFDSPESQEGDPFGFDSNRFTPTLHASLVSEILTLRRELDSKHQFIDGLEENLKDAQAENETLSEELRESNKKSRQIEQKFKNLENGSFDAVEGLLGERDNVKSANQELRARLDALGKKNRKLEEENVQFRDMWEKERQSWGNEKRQLEQKVHISETRLRRMVEEMSAQKVTVEGHHSETDDSFMDDDAASARTFRHSRHTRNQSSTSTRSFATSIGSVRRPGMSSLANELISDDEDYETDDINDDDDLPFVAEDRWSVYSKSSAKDDSKAKKILGLTANTNASSETLTEENVRAPSAESARSPSLAARLGFQFGKGGFKNSDPTKASSRPTSPASSLRKKEGLTDSPLKDIASEQSQFTKAIGSSQDLTQSRVAEQSQQLNLTSRRPIEAPISPPETPHCTLPVDPKDLSRASPAYSSTSTQTDLSSTLPTTGDLALRRKASLSPVEVLPIPSITIQPPMSPCSVNTVVSPSMRSASVQTDSTIGTRMQDVAVQTEEIKIDLRSTRLPAHLLPSALESPPLMFKENMDESSKVTSCESPTDHKRKPSVHRSTFSKDGNRLPLVALSLPPPRLRVASHDDDRQQQWETKPIEPNGKSSPWQLDSDASDVQGEYSDVDQRAVFGNMPGLVRPSVRSFFNGPPKTVPEDRAISPANTIIPPDKWSPSANRSGKDSDGSSIPSRPSSSRGGSSSRKIGPFFSSHERFGRPSSSGSYSVRAQPPPYPIPSRSSSRAPSHAAMDEPQSPILYDAYSVRSKRSSKDSRIAPGGGLRKVQSSGTMRHNATMSPRRKRRAPNLEPIQSMALDTSSINKLLPPSLTTPAQDNFGDNHENMDFGSPELDQDSAVEEEEEASQDNAIVDAIAATMVGEWMWKYVRRRRSFGLGEPRADQVDDGAGNSGIRHKRWVWLSPYEHTIMWSAKQPNSGAALLGKNGRKLVIKSVLDVKDATPLHKSASHEPIFDRSILILTPERALKFTAPNKERHYLWLTALSFLAQSGRGPPQVPRVSAVPDLEPPEYDQRRRSSLMPGPPPPIRGPVGPAFEPPQRVGTADSVAPPNISRIPGGKHQRKRSSTNPQCATANAALSPNEVMSLSSAFSRRASNTTSYRPSLAGSSTRTSATENIETIRMDAFIGQGREESVLSVPGSLGPGYQGGRRSGKENMSHENDHDPFEKF